MQHKYEYGGESWADDEPWEPLFPDEAFRLADAIALLVVGACAIALVVLVLWHR